VDELNRDLLLAVLALITDAIPRHALSEALAVWARDRQQSLAQILVRNGAIDPQRLQALRCLSESHFHRHQGDLRTCLDSWNALGLTNDVLTEVDDLRFKTTIGPSLGLEATLPAQPIEGGIDETIAGDGGAAETIALDGREAVGLTSTPGGPGGDRFRPIRLHARGGIGQVWVARDGELQREVALKVIQDRFAGRADQRARFVLEAEITGNLEHPGIVPVYSLGRNAEGHPYYAMRFIRGQSMASAIRQFHLHGRAKGTEAARSGAIWGVEFRELLVRFLDVCDAIDYAHSRGVLHRDLKPANIMLGRYGETLVVDWGLAKVIDRPDILPVIAGGDAEPSLTVTGAGSACGDTQPGTTIGTPSYMSPEQARGALDEMGPTSDVYSLGATLYEILTGRVAFAGEKTADVLARVVKGEFRPPRAVLRAVPAPLEAICLKAMALERRGRYDTVRELARDVRHWLADEPVIAYPEGRAARVSRRLRRHRTWTLAAAAALIGITLAATVGVVLVERARRREFEARTLAETNFALARKAVEDYFTRVSEDTLLKAQDSVDNRRLRGELLKTALEYYRDFLRQRSGDPERRRDLADAQFRVGQIIREIGDQPEDAINAFIASITLWDELLADAPDDPDVRAHLAQTYLALGEQLAWIREFPRAFAALGRSREILRKLRDANSADASYRVRLADCDRELGIAEGEAGELDRGLEHLREAETLLRGLIANSPGETAIRKRLADTINGLGYIHSRKGQNDEAIAAIREFQEICQGLLDDDRSGRRSAELLNLLALSHYNMGAILSKQDPGKALEIFEKALDYRSALVEAHPSVNDFREKLALSLEEIAPFRHKSGRSAEAFDAIRKSIEIFERLVASQPDQPRYRAELGRALNIHGYLQDEFRDNVRALPTLERALREQERAVAESPESDLYKGYVIDILQNLGEQYADLGRVDEGLPYYRRAVEIRRQLLAAHPGDRDRNRELAEQLAMLAEVERHHGDPASAERSFAEAVAVLESPTTAAADSAVQVLRGSLLAGEAKAVSDQGFDRRALPILRRAVAILAPFGSSATEDPVPRQRLTEALWETARLLRRTGASNEADLLDAERQALWKDRPPGDPAALALQETTQAALVGYGRSPVGVRAEAVRRVDLDMAAENLRMAAALGFHDPETLRKHRDGWLLLAHPDVLPIIEDIAFPEDPFEPAERSN
jgi:serine/threonine-protein kinase